MAPPPSKLHHVVSYKSCCVSDSWWRSQPGLQHQACTTCEADYSTHKSRAAWPRQAIYAQAVTACAPPPSRQQAGHPGNHLRAHSGTQGLPQGSPAGGQGGGGRACARAGGLLYSVAKAPGLSTSIIPWAAKGQRRGCRGAGAAERRDGSQEAAGKAGDGPAHTKHARHSRPGAGRHCAAGGHPRQSHRTGAAEGKRVGQWAPHLCLRATAVAGHRCRRNAVPPARGLAPTPRGWRWPCVAGGRAGRAAGWVLGIAARRGRHRVADQRRVAVTGQLAGGGGGQAWHRAGTAAGRHGREGGAAGATPWEHPSIGNSQRARTRH